MSIDIETKIKRKNAVEFAIANSALEGLHDDGLLTKVYDDYINGIIPDEKALVDAVKEICRNRLAGMEKPLKSNVS